jgi:hypothetical protein
MSDAARFKIDELAAQYALHPESRDVYVEGETDKSFLNWLLREKHLGSSVAVYPIDAVDVPAASVDACGEKRGEKGEVVTLALELERRLPGGHRHVTCFADADYSYVLRSVRLTPLLVYTDGTCLEMYACNETTLDKFLQVTLGGFRYSADHVWRMLTPIMVSRFLARATNESLGWGMTWSDSLSGVNVKDDGRVEFDTNGFLNQYLIQNGRIGSRVEFMAEYDTLRQRIGTDIRQYIHCDDFAAILSHFVRRWLKKPLKNRFNAAEAVAAAMKGCLEVSRLVAEPAFGTLLSRLS